MQSIVLLVKMRYRISASKKSAETALSEEYNSSIAALRAVLSEKLAHTNKIYQSKLYSKELQLLTKALDIDSVDIYHVNI